MDWRGASVALGAAVLALSLAGAGLSRAQNNDAIGTILQSPPASKPAAKPEPPATPPPAAASQNDENTTDETNPEVESAVPEAKPAPAKPVEPMKRPRYAVAVLQALDKVTAETVRFEAPVNQPVRYKTLIFIVRACETTAPDESILDAAAHVEIDSQPPAPDGGAPLPARRVFMGWMFANSPGLNLFQNAGYDAWLIACKTAAPGA